MYRIMKILKVPIRKKGSDKRWDLNSTFAMLIAMKYGMILETLYIYSSL